MKKKINLIFCGEKKLSLDCLEFILNNYNQINLLAIATRKKTKVWWGEQYLRNFAIKKKIKLIKSKDILNYKNVNILLSVQFPYIIKREVLDSVDLAINLHTGLLPDYKGCNLPYHVILNNEKYFGSTLHLMDEKVDSGDIIFKKKFKIPVDSTARELYEENNKVAFNLFKKNFKKILLKSYKLRKQNNTKYFKVYKKNSINNKEINLKWSFKNIKKKVRALEFFPFEPAFIKLKSKKIYLLTKPEEFYRKKNEL